MSDGYGGNWKISPSNQMFNAQAWLALIGAVLVVASAFLGHPKPTAKADRATPGHALTLNWLSGRES